MVAVVNTVVAAYYYLRVVGVILFGDAEDSEPIRPSAGEITAVAIGVAGALLFGIVPWLVLQFIDASLTIA